MVRGRPSYSGNTVRCLADGPRAIWRTQCFAGLRSDDACWKQRAGRDPGTSAIERFNPANADREDLFEVRHQRQDDAGPPARNSWPINNTQGASCSGTDTMSYDGVGNVLTRMRVGGGTASVTYNYNRNSDQLSTATPSGSSALSYSYDADGNLLKRTLGK